MLPLDLRLKLRATVNKLPVPEFDHTELTVEEVARIRLQLGPEVRALYDYMGIEDDPWHFLGRGEGDIMPLRAARAGSA
jgi:hypothetical protein